MKELQLQCVLLLVVAAVIDAQTLHWGKCPQPAVQEDFSVAPYLGRWYEIQKLPAVFERGKCNQANYSVLEDGTVKVHNAEILSDGNINSIEGVAKIEDPSQPAKLSVSFFKGVPDAPYWVLSTDFHSYSLVYSCSDYLGLFHVDFAWILARTRVLTGDVIGRLHAELSAAAGVDVKRLATSNQTGCEALDR